MLFVALSSLHPFDENATYTPVDWAKWAPFESLASYLVTGDK
jgi:hypothetical protein